MASIYEYSDESEDDDLEQPANRFRAKSKPPTEIDEKGYTVRLIGVRDTSHKASSQRRRYPIDTPAPHTASHNGTGYPTRPDRAHSDHKNSKYNENQDSRYNDHKNKNSKDMHPGHKNNTHPYHTRADHKNNKYNENQDNRYNDHENDYSIHHGRGSVRRHDNQQHSPHHRDDNKNNNASTSRRKLPHALYLRTTPPEANAYETFIEDNRIEKKLYTQSKGRWNDIAAGAPIGVRAGTYILHDIEVDERERMIGVLIEKFKDYKY